MHAEFVRKGMWQRNWTNAHTFATLYEKLSFEVTQNARLINLLRECGLSGTTGVLMLDPY